MSAASGEGQVLADPAVIIVEALAPGERFVQPVVVSNFSDHAVTVSYGVETTGPLAEGPNPLEVSYVWDVSRVEGCGDALAIPAGESIELDVSAEMPEEAGNDYQGLQAEAVLTFSYTECRASGEPGSGNDGLAETGIQVVASVALAVVLLSLGALMLMRRSKGSMP